VLRKPKGRAKEAAGVTEEDKALRRFALGKARLTRRLKTVLRAVVSPGMSVVNG
jgi:hypothetical protein